MNKRNLTLGMAVFFSIFITGCASTPQNSQKVDEARAAYDEIRNDPDVARSGDRQLRDARNQLARAESLLEEGGDMEEIEQAAYLASRHAQIAAEQGKRAGLQDQIRSAEERRKELQLQMRQSEAQAAQQEAAELRQQMKEMEAEMTDRGMVLTLGDVLFDLNKTELKAAGEVTVGRLADFMKEYEERRVRVEGYTDSTGEASYNQSLSEKRANAVRDALASMGIGRSRIETKGFGEQYPVATNDNSAGRQQNRRVEIVISDQNGMIKTR